MSAKGDLKKIGVELQKNHVVTVPQGDFFGCFLVDFFRKYTMGQNLKVSLKSV